MGLSASRFNWALSKYSFQRDVVGGFCHAIQVLSSGKNTMSKTPPTRVIPVKTGIQDIRIISYYLDSRLRGNDTINKDFLLIWLNIAKNKPHRLAKKYCQHLLTKSLICDIVTCSEMRNRLGNTFPTSNSTFAFGCRTRRKRVFARDVVWSTLSAKRSFRQSYAPNAEVLKFRLERVGAII